METENKDIIQNIHEKEQQRTDILLTQKQKYVENMKTLLKCMIYLVVFGIFTVTFHINIINAKIPSESMETTIMTGDRLFGYKNAYKNEDPQRNDIIIFNDPMNPDTYLIKRIIGMPGDTLIFQDEKVYLNDLQHELNDYFCQGKTTAGNLPDNTITVPENCYFVMGDNRENSFDSRYWTTKNGKNIPFVTRDMIIAKAVFRYYPFNNIGFLS